MLSTNTFYHIYNHANGNDNLYISDENYRFFLNKYHLHISPIADTFAYCLMPNHFHFLIKIKTLEELIKLKNSLKTETFPKFGTLEKLDTIENLDIKEIELFLSKQFANLFSSYTQSFNKMYQRKGSLFLKNFKYKKIETISYYKNLVQYIHANPVHHGFTKDIEDWKFSSYNSIISNQETNLKKEIVLEWFSDLTVFTNQNKQHRYFKMDQTFEF